jgi:hypothetical protein
MSLGIRGNPGQEVRGTLADERHSVEGLFQYRRLTTSVDNFSRRQVWRDWKIAILLLQLRVLRLGSLQDGDVGSPSFQRES